MKEIIERLKEMAQQEYDVSDIRFVSVEQLREYGTERGMWATLHPDNEIIILIQNDLKQLDQVISFSHELGHVVDFVKDYRKNSDRWKAMDWSPSASILREQIAWRHSINLLKSVGFQEWDTFIKTVSFSMGSYYQNTWEPYFRYMVRYRKRKPELSFPAKFPFLSQLKKMIKE
jgi:hypothetical protein